MDLELEYDGGGMDPNGFLLGALREHIEDLFMVHGIRSKQELAHMTDDDVLYVADYQLREGIVIANSRDFTEIGFIDDAMPEGVTVDRMGNVYAGEVLQRNLKKFKKIR